MTGNEYQLDALRTASEQAKEDLLTNGALGLSGETGEVSDMVKKYKFQGHPLDTQALAKELGPSGITVNCVSPGVIDTAMCATLDEETRMALAEETPLGRLGTPEEVAQALLFLASDHASFITGQVLGVNGGFIT